MFSPDSVASVSSLTFPKSCPASSPSSPSRGYAVPPWGTPLPGDWTGPNQPNWISRLLGWSRTLDQAASPHPFSLFPSPLSPSFSHPSYWLPSPFFPSASTLFSFLLSSLFPSSFHCFHFLLLFIYLLLLHSLFSFFHFV